MRLRPRRWCLGQDQVGQCRKSPHRAPVRPMPCPNSQYPAWIDGEPPAPQCAVGRLREADLFSVSCGYPAQFMWPCKSNAMSHYGHTTHRNTNAPIATAQQTVDADNTTKAPLALFASHGAPTCIISLHQRLPLCDESVLFRDEQQEIFVHKTVMMRDFLRAAGHLYAHHHRRIATSTSVAACHGRPIMVAIAAVAGVSGPRRYR